MFSLLFWLVIVLKPYKYMNDGEGKVKFFVGHYAVYNEICPLHLTHPSMPQE